jgi:uncharacterized protein YbjT (DUF2867 family)
MSKKILITGATGSVAGLTIQSILAKNKDVSLRAYVRNPEKAAKLKDLGIELVQGDFENQDALNKAAEEMDAVFSLTIANPDADKQGIAITEAAKQAGVKHIVRNSAIGAAADAPTENGKLHFATDEDIIASGLRYTIFRPHFFMQNLFYALQTIKEQGNMYWGMGDGKLGLVDVRDLADSYAEVLVNGGHENKIYTPTGPESISFYDMAKTISDSWGKPVTYVPVTPDNVYETLKGMGADDFSARLMKQYSIAYGDNWGNFVNDDVETVTGHKARSFRQFVDEVMIHALK